MKNWISLPNFIGNGSLEKAIDTAVFTLCHVFPFQECSGFLQNHINNLHWKSAY